MVKNAFESVVPRGPGISPPAVPKTYRRGKSPAPTRGTPDRPPPGDMQKPAAKKGAAK